MARRMRTFFGQLEASGLGYMGKWIGVATLIGVATGLAAVGFDWLVELGRDHLVPRTTGVEGSGLGGGEGSLLGRTWPLLLLLPAGGLLVGYLTHRFTPEARGHGGEQLVTAFHQEKGFVRKRVLALKALSSAITIGTGGSGGQEGPIAQIGSSVGSTTASSFKLGDRDRRLFLLTGASAGVGALFCAPLAGALFAPEVLYRRPEFEGDAIIPCIISSIVGYTTYTGITGETKVIHIAPEVLTDLAHSDPRQLLLYLVLALLCTLVSFFFVKTFYGLQGMFEGARWLWRPARPALGGLLLALLAIGLAPLTGDHGVLFGGYDLMTGSIASELAISTMAILVIGKVFATSFTISSGGSGGVFAPMLAIGALLGAIVGQVGAELFPDWQVYPGSFALVGMGGFFAGVAKTPITSVIIVSEMTGSYGLLLPLMLVAVVHLMLARSWGIYATQVPGPADSPAHYGDFVFRPTGPLARIDGGVQATMGRVLRIEGHRRGVPLSSAAATAGPLARFGRFDPAFLLQEVLPLVLILVGATLATERRRGSRLQWMIAHGAPGRAFVLGRWAFLGSLALVLVAGVVVTAVLASPEPLQGSGWARLAGLVATHLAFLGVVAGGIVIVATRARSANLATLALLSIWIVGTTLMPRATATLASAVAPLPTRDVFESEMREARAAQMDGHNHRDARVAALEAELLARHGVDTVDDLPLNFRGVVMQADEEVGNAVWDEHFGRLEETLASQAAAARLVSLVNPLQATRAASMTFAGTDLAHDLAFQDAAEVYRRELIGALNDEYAYGRATTSENPNVSSASFFADLTAFTYPTPPVRSVVGTRTVELVGLGLWALAMLLLLLDTGRAVERRGGA